MERPSRPRLFEIAQLAKEGYAGMGVTDELLAEINGLITDGNREISRLEKERVRYKLALDVATKGLGICDLILRAAKPCVNGGYDMNEMAADETLFKITEILIKE